MKNKFNKLIDKAKELMNSSNYDKNEVTNLLYEAVDCVLCEDTLYASDTGLKYNLWIDPPGNNRKTHNLPRIKIAVTSNKKYPVIFHDDGTIEVINENKIPGGVTKEKKFILDNIDLFKIQYNYPHIFTSKIFKNEFIKYLKGEYSKQQLVDILFKEHEEEKSNL